MSPTLNHRSTHVYLVYANCNSSKCDDNYERRDYKVHVKLLFLNFVEEIK